MVEPIAPEAYRDLVRQALAEDRGRGDVTSAATIARGTRARGTIVAKSDLVVAGIDVEGGAIVYYALSTTALTEEELSWFVDESESTPSAQSKPRP